MEYYFSGRRKSDADKAAADTSRDWKTKGAVGFGRGCTQQKHSASDNASQRRSDASRFIVLASLICVAALTLYLYNGGDKYTAVSTIPGYTAAMQYDMGDAAAYAEQVIAENDTLARFLGIEVSDEDIMQKQNPNEAVYVSGEMSYSDSMKNTLPGDGGKWSVWDYFSDVLAELIEW